MFATSLFLKKIYEVALLSLDNPLCVKAFYLLKENKDVYFFCSFILFLSKPSGSLGGLNKKE